MPHTGERRERLVSPDGDGIDDTVGFDVTYLKNRGIARWQIIIATASGTPVYHFNWNEGAGEPPLYLVWDGTGKNGSTVPRGLYYYHAWVEDSVGRVFSSVAKPLFVEDHRLSAWFDPSTCTDGSPFEVNAQTLPAASSVVASIPGAEMCLDLAGRHPLAGKPHHGSAHTLGRHLATVTAYFPRAMRSIDVPFERARDLWLLASVEPTRPHGIRRSRCRAGLRPPFLVFLRLSSEPGSTLRKARKGRGMPRLRFVTFPQAPTPCSRASHRATR